MGKKWYEPGGEIPESIGRRADLFKEVEELYRDMKAEVDEVYARMSEIRESIIADLSKSDDTGAAGLKYRVQVKTDTKPKVNDWDKVYEYIASKKRFDLLQKRLSDRAVMDIIEQEGKLAGVEKIHLPKLSITKIAK
jgi:hypothetical protein